jgi:hypothetical protein
VSTGVSFNEIKKMTEIYFDKELIQYLKAEANVNWLMTWRYRSNWRILHIDGFEGGRKLPVSTGIKRTFFEYKVSE